MNEQDFRAFDRSLLDRLQADHPGTRIESMDSAHTVQLVFPHELSGLITDFAASLEF